MIYRNYDTENMLGVLEQFPEQIKEGYALQNNIMIKGSINKIFICGTKK